MKLQRWEGFSDLPLGGRFSFSSSILLSVQEPIARGFCHWTSLEHLQGVFLSFSNLPLGGRVSFSSSLLLSVQEPIPKRYCRWTSLERFQVFTKRIYCITVFRHDSGTSCSQYTYSDSFRMTSYRYMPWRCKIQSNSCTHVTITWNNRVQFGRVIWTSSSSVSNGIFLRAEAIENLWRGPKVENSFQEWDFRRKHSRYILGS